MEIKFNLNDSELYIPAGRLYNHSLREVLCSRDLMESVEIAVRYLKTPDISSIIQDNTQVKLMKDNSYLYNDVVYRFIKEKVQVQAQEKSFKSSIDLENIFNEVCLDVKSSTKIKKAKTIKKY